MATTTLPAEQKVFLRGVSWETYQRLLHEHEDRSGARFTYDDGHLEILVLSSRHEQAKRTLEVIVDILAEEFDLDVHRVGSMTFQREDLRKGFEPDSAFYIAHAPQVEGREVDPERDPPPDLVIEVDVASPSLDRLPLLAAFGVPEVWRYDGSRVAMYRLESGKYTEAASSLAFPALCPERVTEFLRRRQTLRNRDWVREIRNWARQPF